MPNYSFKCKECKKVINLMCKISEFDEKKPASCDECGGRVVQDFSGIGVSYKCGGFYTTDSKPNFDHYGEE